VACLGARVFERDVGEIDTGHRRPGMGEFGSVEPRAAAQIEDRFADVQAEGLDDPGDRAGEELGVARGQVDLVVEVDGQHLPRHVRIGPQLGCCRFGERHRPPGNFGQAGEQRRRASEHAGPRGGDGTVRIPFAPVQVNPLG